VFGKSLWGLQSRDFYIHNYIPVPKYRVGSQQYVLMIKVLLYAHTNWLTKYKQKVIKLSLIYRIMNDKEFLDPKTLGEPFTNFRSPKFSDFCKTVSVTIFSFIHSANAC
jgi:hypothetical protein